MGSKESRRLRDEWEEECLVGVCGEMCFGEEKIV